MRPERRERERIVGRLRAAYSGDMLGTETFELRVAEALVARTKMRLRATVADLPVPRWRRLAATVRSRLFGDGLEALALRPPAIAVGEALVVGREPGANLVVDDPAVSRRHLLLRREAEGWSVVDLGSLNGTFVNGFRVERAMLEPRDELRVGDTLLRLAR